MDEGSSVLDVSIRRRDILRIRRLIFTLIWIPICIVLVWLAVTTPWVFFLFSPLGLASLSFGAALILFAQIYSELGWTSRLPKEIPSRQERNGIKFRYILVYLPIGFCISLGISWARQFLPEVFWMLVIGLAAFLTFILGVCIAGFWPLLLTQLYWERREGKLIVKQGKYWVGITKQ